jgi:hypothetical protein
MNAALNRAKARHDHRRSLWIIGIGESSFLWCYQCGAIRVNAAGAQYKWRRPTGIGGPNPAMTMKETP